jgi:MFS family permease
LTAPSAVGRDDRWRLGLAAVAVLLAAADTYVVVVVLPNIMNGVGLGLDRLQRATPIISGFLLGYTAVLPLIGRIADLAGTAPTFAGCLSAFAVGSVVTATAHSLPVVVLGRAVQGLGGGGLVPVTLAMVASRWPPDDRGTPLGVVGALQELGSVVGPLYGAAIVAVASWRAIFWVNIPVAVVLGGGFWLVGRQGGTGGGAVRVAGGQVAAVRRRRDVVGPGLLLIGAAALVLGLDAPASLATSAAWGQLYSPQAGGQWAPFTTPLVLASLGVLMAAAAWEVAAPAGVQPFLPLRRAPSLLARSDLPGAALLAGVLACIVVAFSTADPSRQVVASSAPFVAPLGVALAVAFWIRQRRAASPLIDPGSFSRRPAWGALLVNLSLGGGLMAALIDVPLFARSTVDSSSETAAALVLLRFLIAVPIGAVFGGVLCRNRGRAPFIAGTGMALATVAFIAMTSWSATALGGGPRWSDLELAACGFGFGLAVAPVNVAVLGAVEERHHALAGALAVVARTIGMLAGLSALTAIALRRFYQAAAKIGSPLVLCHQRGSAQRAAHDLRRGGHLHRRRRSTGARTAATRIGGSRRGSGRQVGGRRGGGRRRTGRPAAGAGLRAWGQLLRSFAHNRTNRAPSAPAAERGRRPTPHRWCLGHHHVVRPPTVARTRGAPSRGHLPPGRRCGIRSPVWDPPRSTRSARPDVSWVWSRRTAAGGSSPAIRSGDRPARHRISSAIRFPTPAR